MLSEKLIQEIEKATGLTDLAGKIAHEEIQDAELVKTKHFTEGEHRQLVTNLTSDVPKEKWEEAKVVGIEKSIKKLKEDKGLDFQGKTPEALYDYLQKQIELSKETDSAKIKSEFESDINQLKELVKTKESEINEIRLNAKNSTINSKIDSLFNTIQIDAPAHLKTDEEKKAFIDLEREKAKIHFKSLHSFDIDEYNNIVSSKEGQILKDDTLNPVKVDNLIQDYANKSFMSLKQSSKGRGEGDRLPSRDMTNFKDMSEVIDHYEKKGLKPGTSQMDAVVAEWQKTQ